MRAILLSFASVLFLAACDTDGPAVGPDGKPLPQVYKIRAADERRIPYNVLDSVNTLRAAAGLVPVSLNARLTAAAATHSRDMSIQNRPWHFGSDGSSPLQRVQRVGYTGRLTGENISETYETELETLSAWMQDQGTRRVILDPESRDMGVAWFQEDNGKIWWTVTFGTREIAIAEVSETAEN